MSSSKFVDLAKKIAVKNKEMYDSLVEFEKTKKIRTKTRINFSIDKSLASRFRKYCKNKGYNMSSKIEKAIEQILN